MAKEITQWEHFKKNYLLISVGFVLASFWMYYDVEAENKWLAIFPFIVGAVIIPIGNYLSWKNYIQ
jgi:hypothetical protein